MEGGEKYPMKNLEQIYVENFIMPQKPIVSPSKDIDPEQIILKLRSLFVDIHYGLKSFRKNDVKLHTIARLIRKSMFNVYNTLNISLRKENPSVDFSKMPLIKKIPLIQGYMNSAKLDIEKLITFYKEEGNEYVVNQLEKSLDKFSTPSILFDNNMFKPYRKYF
jgi:hypothetical protein